MSEWLLFFPIHSAFSLKPTVFLPLRQPGLARLPLLPLRNFHLDLGVLGSGSPCEEFPPWGRCSRLTHWSMIPPFKGWGAYFPSFQIEPHTCRAFFSPKQGALLMHSFNFFYYYFFIFSRISFCSVWLFPCTDLRLSLINIFISK